MRLHLEPAAGGGYSLTGAGGSLTGLEAGVEVDVRGGGPTRLTPEVWTAESDTVLTAVAGGLALRLTAAVPPAGPGVLLTLSVENSGVEAMKLRRLLPLMAGEESAIRLANGGVAGGGAGVPPQWSVYKQGWQSWSYVGWRPLDGRDIHPRSLITRGAHADPSWPAPTGPGRFQSEGMAMVGRPGGGHVLLAGFAGGARLLGRLEIRHKAGVRARLPARGAAAAPGGEADAPVTLQAWCEADGLTLPPGSTLTAEPLLVAAAAEREALDGYAITTGRLMHSRVPDRSPAVWCSWYYHFTRVTEEDVLMALNSLKELRQSHPVDVIQLDDGYQQAVGDWLDVKAKFPHGLAWLAEQIRNAGFTPGIWIAPLIALRRSRLFRAHPDWFVKDEAGRPKRCDWHPLWGDTYYALDTTHPEAAAWLEGLVRALVAAGFTYLKLDFLFGGAMQGVRHDPTVTRAGALRRGLEIIRRAAGEEVFLLGCGCPMLPAVGVVDAMRVGPDVAPSWGSKYLGLPFLTREPAMPAMKNAVRVALTRQWMHGRLWLNDPDSLVLRQQQTGLTPDEARALATVGGLSGGILSFSDQPGQLSTERLDWLRRVLPFPGQEPFAPVTLLDGEFPFLSTVRQGDRLLLMAFNGTEAPRLLKVSPGAIPGFPSGACHVYDCWEGRYLGVRSGPWEDGTVVPHGARVLALTPVGAPRLVGSTFHLNPGLIGEERPDSGQGLVLRLPPDRVQTGTLTVALPPGQKVVAVKVEQGRLDGSTEGPEVLGLQVTSLGGAVIHIETTHE